MPRFRQADARRATREHEGPSHDGDHGATQQRAGRADAPQQGGSVRAVARRDCLKSWVGDPERMLLGGVDEAGRGCVLGPLAVAGVSVDSERLQELAELGVKDSKLLSPGQRDALYPEILRVCRGVEVSRIPPKMIDRYVSRGKKYRRLNYLETIHMAKVIDVLGVEEVFVDAPD